jgi:hypothetical protein
VASFYYIRTAAAADTQLHPDRIRARQQSRAEQSGGDSCLDHDEALWIDNLCGQKARGNACRVNYSAGDAVRWSIMFMFMGNPLW